MSRLRVNAFGISLDGYGAGPDQALDSPMGVGGMALHQWVFGTKTFQKMAGDFAGSLIGDKVGREGIDDDFAARGFDNLGAWIMGRNMFAPSRGAWPDDGWKGWWGETPPYHVPVFVLTHHARAPLTMEGGTTFHFRSAAIDEVLAEATEAADGLDVRVGGGVSTARAFLGAGLVDDLHVAIAPILLGRGTRLWDDLRGLDTTHKVTTEVAESGTIHVTFAR